MSSYCDDNANSNEAKYRDSDKSMKKLKLMSVRNILFYLMNVKKNVRFIEPKTFAGAIIS